MFYPNIVLSLVAATIEIRREATLQLISHSNQIMLNKQIPHILSQNNVLTPLFQKHQEINLVNQPHSVTRSRTSENIEISEFAREVKKISVDVNL